MSQLAIEYSGDYAAEDGWRSVRRAFAEVVEAMTAKAVCDRLDISPSQLSDALAERDRKRVAGEWIVRLIVLAPERHAMHLLRALADLRDCDAVKRVPDPAEELRRYRETVARLAPAIAELADEQRGRR